VAEYFSKGHGLTDEATARVTAAQDAVFPVGGHDAEGNYRGLSLKVTGELNLPSIEQRLGSIGEAAATSDSGSFSFIALFKRLLAVKLDLSLTALRDALRGASHKTLSDLDVQLAAANTRLAALTVTAASFQRTSVANTYVALTGGACRTLTLLNSTDADLEVRRGGAGATLLVPSGVGYTFNALANAGDLAVRRADLNTASVTVSYELEG
jgi:hypothetical protein